MTTKFIANSVIKPLTALLLGSIFLFTAGCANVSPSIGISIPIGGMGAVGVSVGPGGVTGHAGVGTTVGGVSVGGGINTNGTVSGTVGTNVGGATVGVGASGQIKKEENK